MALCIALAPTRSPPNSNDEGIVHKGCRPPNKAATIPLNPADPVKPSEDPSVIKRCDWLPNTKIAPAKPHIAPEYVIASKVILLTGIPAYFEAFGLCPTARTR